MATVRPAAVAGTFYPGNASTLAAQLGELIAAAEGDAPRFASPKALIVPHAGYVYSGPVAARAYAELAAGRGVVKRVVLLGPVHRVPVRGLALPGANEFETPLGRIPIDAEALAALTDLPQVVTSAPAHAFEHSLEVQLPFLQRVLGRFSLVPFAVGQASVAEVAEVIERLWGGDETLVVVSTDMSHYHRYDEAKRIDASTIARISAYATDLDHEEACGATPLNGLLHVAATKGLAIKPLAACNSGDTAGDRQRVVGYSAFALYEGEAVSQEDAGRTLVGIARGAIGHRLGQAAEPPRVDRPAWLAQPGATFVTLTMGGTLRGCIGSLQAHRPLGVDVAANAENAAFRDPRFAPLAAHEWPRIEAEVSLLTVPEVVPFSDEVDLLVKLRPGVDGVILEQGARRGTFLPQVWESLPDRRRFIEELKRKAGLPADTRLVHCKVWRYQVMKWRESVYRAH
jgi:AmmeMemoRadiSam system protein B/AmmeMemoRadiSam system protein A